MPAQVRHHQVTDYSGVNWTVTMRLEGDWALSRAGSEVGYLPADRARRAIDAAAFREDGALAAMRLLLDSSGEVPEEVAEPCRDAAVSWMAID